MLIQNLFAAIPNTIAIADTSSEIATSDIELVTPVLNGFVGFFYEIAMNAFAALIDMFTSNYTATSKIFYELLGLTSDKPWNEGLFDAFYWIAILLLIFIFVFSMILISLGPVIDQKNDVFELIIRFFLALGIIVCIREFLAMINEMQNSIHVRMGKNVKDQISKLSANPNFGITESESILWGAFSYIAILLMIINIIFIIIVVIEFIKFMFEIIERYLVVQILLISSPVAGSCFVSRSTSSIFSNFFRMYLSQLFILCMNDLYLYLVATMMVTSFATSATSVSNTMIIIVTLKCAQRIDSYMKSMGLSVAQTGGALMGSIMGAAGTLGGLAFAAKKGANLTGSMMEKAGIARGNYGMASIGTSLKNVGSGNSKNATTAKSLDTFGKGGGFANMDRRNAEQMRAATNAAASMLSANNYNALSQLPHDVQSEAIKNAMAKNGDSLAAATSGAFKASDIKNAHMDKYGNITGTLSKSVATTGGYKTMNASFTASAAKSTSGFELNDIGDGVQRGFSINTDATELKDTYGMKCDFSDIQEGGMSNVEATFGVSTPNEELSQLGATSARYSDGLLTYSNGDEIIGYQNVATGEYMYNSSVGYSDLSERDVMNPNNGFTAYMPDESQIVKNSFVNHSDGSCSFQVRSSESGSDEVYDVRINNTNSKYLDSNSKGHIVHSKDIMAGDRHIYVTRARN